MTELLYSAPMDCPKDVSELIQAYGASSIVEVLAEQMLPRRIERIEQLLEARNSALSVAVERPQDLHNALAMVRSAEALGIDSLHIIDWQGKRRKGPVTTKGAYHWMHVRYHCDLPTFFESQKRRVMGACMDGDYNLDELPLDKPLCLLFGNESDGLSDAARAGSDGSFRIPLYGMTESLNLSVAAGISLYSVLGRLRAAGIGKLEGEALQMRRAFYYLRAIGIDRARLALRKSAASIKLS